LSFLVDQIPDMEHRFGLPDHLTHIQPVSPTDFSYIKSTMVDGRAHDITFFISKDDGYIFIAKPFYPPGLFRAPSGGVHRGEDFEVGAKREAREETGVEIELEQYFLRIDVRFQAPNDQLDWTSHIFKARYISGEIEPIDRQEISAARLVHLDEIPAFREIMLATGRGGFAYRAFLTDEAIIRL
jgi:ADP-ribose pyrophosphatase YjhB (NUDIX family)